MTFKRHNPVPKTSPYKITNCTTEQASQFHLSNSVFTDKLMPGPPS